MKQCKESPTYTGSKWVMYRRSWGLGEHVCARQSLDNPRQSEEEVTRAPSGSDSFPIHRQRRSEWITSDGRCMFHKTRRRGVVRLTHGYTFDVCTVEPDAPSGDSGFNKASRCLTGISHSADKKKHIWDQRCFCLWGNFPENRLNWGGWGHMAAIECTHKEPSV